MLAQAAADTPPAQYANINFRAGGAEALPFVGDGDVDLVVAGQAAHWFDPARVWRELARVVRPGGAVAFWGYADATLPGRPGASRAVREWAHGEEKMGPYWTWPGRGICEGLYRDLVPDLTAGWDEVERVEYWPSVKGPHEGEGTRFLWKNMTLNEFADYVRTWSGYHGWKEAHKNAKVDVVDELIEEIVKVEGFKGREQEVTVEWGTGLVMARRV